MLLFVQKMGSMDILTIRGSTPEQFTETMKADAQKFAKIARETNIQPQ